jgi:hypothetical protein
VELRRGVGLLVGVGVVFGAMGWATGSMVSADSGTTSTAEAPAEDPTTSAPEEPLRIALAGDSVMAGLAPAVEAALDGTGDADVQFMVTPSILRDATVRFTWQQELDDFDPDLVVMFVGTWEVGQVTPSDGPGDPGWQREYERDVLDPWIELITERGAEVIWIGAPAVEAPEVNQLFDALNDVYRGLSDRWEEVTYLDSTDALAGVGAGYSPIVTTETGEEVRARQIDGLHLCPDGAVLLARAVLDTVQLDHPVGEVPDWQTGGWRTREEYPAENCPAP